MPTAVSTFLSRLQPAIGGRGDTDADTFIMQGLNFGCTMVALLFEPPELQANGALIATTSSTYVSLSTLTRLRVVKSVYNASSSKKMWHIPFNRYDFVVPSETGYCRFWSRNGSYLYVAPTPEADNSLTIHYDTFPALVTAVGDSIAFSNYDPLVENYALAYAQACLEEGESATMWKGLGDALLVPEQTLLMARQYLEGGPARGNNSGGA